MKKHIYSYVFGMLWLLNGWLLYHAYRPLQPLPRAQTPSLLAHMHDVNMTWFDPHHTPFARAEFKNAELLANQDLFGHQVHVELFDRFKTTLHTATLHIPFNQDWIFLQSNLTRQFGTCLLEARSDRIRFALKKHIIISQSETHVRIGQSALRMQGAHIYLDRPLIEFGPALQGHIHPSDPCSPFRLYS